MDTLFFVILKRRLLGLLAGHFIAEKRPMKVTARDLKKMDYAISTQRLGLRFIKRIRDTFRFRWIKYR